MDAREDGEVTSPRFSFPALLADIGGTNARFALLANQNAALTPVLRLRTGDHADFAAAAQSAIAASGWPRPRSLLVGAAGPVIDRAVTLTNARWRIDGPALANGMSLDQGLLLNDFETLAIALPALGPADLAPIGSFAPGTGNRLVIGPGTGLGVGALAEADGRLLPLPSEGGHVALSAASEDERAILRRLGLPTGRGRAEALLAGPGLPPIYRAVSSGRGAEAAAPDAAEIIRRALAGGDPVAATAVQTQLSLLARFAGDMALTFMATGGVFLAGGVLPRLAGLIDHRRFRAEFSDNEAHAEMLSRLPIWLITAPEPAFAGLAALARRPGTYILKYAERLWR